MQCNTIQYSIPHPNEDLIAWNVRRWKAAHKLVKKHGLWSHKWFTRAVHWHEHVARHDELVILPLLEWRGKEWLMEKRATFLLMVPRSITSSLSILAGRTGTRVTAGGLHKRWHDGYEYGVECLAKNVRVCHMDGVQRRLNN